MTTPDTFDDLAATIRSEGAQAALEHLAVQLRTEHKYHELFDARLMLARLRLGLSVAASPGFDELGEDARNDLEEAYLAACREVGNLFLASDQLREAWMYLRPTGEKLAMAEALSRTTPTQENLETLVEIALHEGICPRLGYDLVLNHFGTCNAISMFDSIAQGRTAAQRRELAGMLVQHVHRELLANLRADLARRGEEVALENTASGAGAIAAIVAGRDWLFADLNYHLDTSHLSATVRLARLVTDHETLALALDLTEYGRRLADSYQYAGEEPFVDLYPTSGLFFAAQIGERVDEALQYFQSRARHGASEQVGTAASEVYVTLLARVQRPEEAFRAAVELLPPGVTTPGFAPSLHELAAESGAYQQLANVFRQRRDRLGFAAALVEASRAAD